MHSCGLHYRCPCDRPCVEAVPLEDVFAHGRPVALAAGEPLWRRGEPADHVAVLCHGVVLVEADEGAGPRARSVEVPRAILGMDSALWSGGTRETEVRALTPIVARLLDATLLRAVVAGGGGPARAVAHMFARACGDADRAPSERVGVLDARVARFSCRLLDAYAVETPRGFLVPVPLGRKQLSEILGCRLARLGSVLRSPPLLGLLSVTSDGLFVSDPALLRLVGAVSWTA